MICPSYFKSCLFGALTESIESFRCALFKQRLCSKNLLYPSNVTYCLTFIISGNSSYKKLRKGTSHCARKSTKDKQYLSPTLSLAQLWRDFVKKKDLPPERMPLSFSSFRDIFKTFNLSFRKPRVDTCPKCDSLKILMKHSTDEAIVEDARALKAAHVRPAELHL